MDQSGELAECNSLLNKEHSTNTLKRRSKRGKHATVHDGSQPVFNLPGTNAAVRITRKGKLKAKRKKRNVTLHYLCE